MGATGLDGFRSYTSAGRGDQDTLKDQKRINAKINEYVSLGGSETVAAYRCGHVAANSSPEFSFA